MYKRQVFRIVVNASTVSSDEIESWREAGADVTRFAACHNCYPKPYTGLALEDIARVKLRLAALGFEIMAFVPGDANVRGPVFEGLPTVEAQRGRASKVALNTVSYTHLDVYKRQVPGRVCGDVRSLDARGGVGFCVALSLPVAIQILIR